METTKINVNKNDQLVINEMVINQFAKSENYIHYKLELKGKAKLIKFWNQLLKQATTTNFGGNLNEQFSFITINNNNYSITFNCPKNEYKNYYSIGIDVKNK